MGQARNGTVGHEMAWARNGTGMKWDSRARNGTVGHEMGRARNGTGTKWPGTKWPARNGPARNGRARNGIQPRPASLKKIKIKNSACPGIRTHGMNFSQNVSSF